MCNRADAMGEQRPVLTERGELAALWLELTALRGLMQIFAADAVIAKRITLERLAFLLPPEVYANIRATVGVLRLYEGDCAAAASPPNFGATPGGGDKPGDSIPPETPVVSLGQGAGRRDFYAGDLGEVHHPGGKLTP
jgi:hypothetical protein